MISLGLLYWLLLILALVFGLWSNRSNLWAGGFGFPLFLWILLAILGVAEFGGPIATHK